MQPLVLVILELFDFSGWATPFDNKCNWSSELGRPFTLPHARRIAMQRKAQRGTPEVSLHPVFQVKALSVQDVMHLPFNRPKLLSHPPV